MSWPPHLFKTKRLLIAALKHLGFRGTIGIRPKDDGTYTIVIEIPAPAPPHYDEGTSLRAVKREASRR